MKKGVKGPNDNKIKIKDVAYSKTMPPAAGKKLFLTSPGHSTRLEIIDKGNESFLPTSLLTIGISMVTTENSSYKIICAINWSVNSYTLLYSLTLV